MSSENHRHRITARDREILGALDYVPLTAGQLLKFSETFPRPFRTERRVRERLSLLAASKLLYRRRYATASEGAPNYYTLSPLGYRVLYGENARPPTKRYFSPVGLARQHHTRCLADFIVHTAVSAKRSGVTLTGFCRENSVQLDVGSEALWPDCAFQLIDADGRAFNFLVELDNRSERVRSRHDFDCWERKIRLYDAYQDLCNTRFRVLIVTTASRTRLDHILETAAELQRHPSRSLFYGVSLGWYLKHTQAVTSACFLDHRSRRVALVPQPISPRRRPEHERNDLSRLRHPC